MIEIDITKSNLFDSLLEIKYGKSYYDIHNDFNLKMIEYLKSNNLLKFEFFEIKGKNSIILSFENVEILSFNIPNKKEGLMLDNFYRGRFEYQNQLYDEFNKKSCFYMDLCEDGDFNFLCSKATFGIISQGKVINLQ